MDTREIKHNGFEAGDEELVNFLKDRFSITIFYKLGYYKDNLTMDKYKDVLEKHGCYFDGFNDADLIEYVETWMLDIPDLKY